MMARALTCQFATLTRAGCPITWPVTPYVNDDRRSIEIPWFVMRTQTWYWVRIWIEVTPLRILSYGSPDVPPSRDRWQ